MAAKGALRCSPIVLYSLLYGVVRLLLEILIVRGRSDAELRAEVLALRHQPRVLERQVGRPRWQPTDRLLLTAISRVLHDGRPAPGVGAFRRRELYLDQGFLPAGLVGAAVDHSNVSDPGLWATLARIHRSLVDREDAIDVEPRLPLVGERIASHLGGPPPVPPGPDRAPARQLCELFDDHLTDPFTLAEAAARLDRSVHPAVPHQPSRLRHRRRVEAARSRLLRADQGLPTSQRPRASTTRYTPPATSRGAPPSRPARYACSHGR